MTNLPKIIRSILLVFWLLASGSGCRVLSIPVNPASGLDAHLVGSGCAGGACGTEGLQGVPTRSVEPLYEGILTRSVEPHYGAWDGSCPPDWLSSLPHREFVGWPVPKRWADWKAKRDLPEPPPYPRFQPLPTRPMFQPRPSLDTNTGDDDHWGGRSPAPTQYGHLPPTP